MQVSVETTGAIGRRLTVELPAERLEKAVAARLQQLAKKVKMPGFRKGKIPMKMIEAQYGDQVLDEAAGELIRSTLNEALGQGGMKPAGQAQKIESKRLQRGQAFEYVVEFEVYPEVKQRSLKGCKLERPVVEITDADIDRTIDTIREQRSNWNTVDRAAKDGDQLLIDYVGRIDGEAFTGGSANKTPLVLGSKSFIPGFEGGLIGAKTGDDKTLDLQFPEDYGNKELAGKAVQFEVTVQEIREAELPEVNADFIKQMGVESGTVADFRAEVIGNLEREKQQRIRDYLANQVEDTLVKKNPLELPKSLIESEINRLQQTYLQGKIDEQMTQSLRGVFTKQAERRVALGVILSEIVRDKELQADADKVRARVEELATGYESPEQVVSWHYADKSRLNSVESMVLQEQVVALLMEDATVKEKSMSFEELLEINKASTPS